MIEFLSAFLLFIFSGSVFTSLDGYISKRYLRSCILIMLSRLVIVKLRRIYLLIMVFGSWLVRTFSYEFLLWYVF